MDKTRDMSKDELTCLRAIVEHGTKTPRMGFAGLMESTGLDEDRARAAVRRLAQRGLIDYRAGGGYMAYPGAHMALAEGR